jgi:hypothetical protein
MKPAEIVLRSGTGQKRRIMEGVNLTKIYYKHIYKYQNISPIQLLYVIFLRKNHHKTSNNIIKMGKLSE